MQEMSSKPNIKMLDDEELRRNVKRFASEYSTQQDCYEFLCKLVEPKDGFHCKFCGVRDYSRKCGNRVFRCQNCKKYTNVLANTIYSGKKRIKAWATRTWFLLMGFGTSSNKFAEELNIAQSSADIMFAQLTLMVLQNMTDLMEVYSGEFLIGFIRRSRETEARMHPRSEQLRIDREMNLAEGVSLDEQDFPETDSEEDIDERPDLSEQEKALLKHINREALHVDEISNQTNLSESSISAALTLLELNGLVVRLPGDRYERPCSQKQSPKKPRDELGMSWTLIDEFIDYVRKYHHGFSRKYLQNYLAAFWCYADREYWNLATFADLCSRSLPITYNDVLEYVSPPHVRVWARGKQIQQM